MPLIIIESPNKVEKIKKITGYEVIATIGHFMDLKSFDIDKDYKPNFEYAESKKKRIMNAIQKAKGQEVYIASDPDREGYAIGYMFFEKIKNVASKIYRAEFHEITPSGIKQGLDNAKLFVDTNFNYYQSFLARRVSDQLIGFLLSPYLTKSLQYNKMLSAGRVQTPALWLITKREQEIKDFAALSEEQKQEFGIVANANIDNKVIIFKHISDDLKELRFQTQQEAQNVCDEIVSMDKALIDKIEINNTSSKPAKPFTTSKLLKAASKALSLPTKDIQNLAQELFAAGLITYIRTDSEYISPEFLKEMQGFYSSIYPNTYQYTEYKAGKNSQAEAHEAIRITHCHRFEECESLCLKENLKDNHIALYKLIFQNTILSQSKPAIYEKMNVTLRVKMKMFKTSFKKLIDEGYLGVFGKNEALSENGDNENDENEESLHSFPYKQGDMIALQDISVKSIKKSAPKRYLEADFIEVMEKSGIGRPSTYATFLPLLLNKEYIEISKDKKREIIPTTLGMSVTQFFSKDNNAWLLDIAFTRDMENELDEIANGSKKYLDFIKTIHSKMNFMPLKAESKEKKDYPPSEKQIKFCKDISTALNIPLPDGLEKDYRIARKFIDENASKMPKKEKKGN
ncbi:DNA topoisomerase [Helicobacter cinaedi]|uniref:type IA DNA topoisomerase n=1 Tax=Helicobacter cinaedi TaxID=213 RepID=UPI001F2EF246|nr:type IA DNA topoisomerase [Helicobacter cinaedi]BDB65279.1 DNA topoisomerase [Helicobacter cinaedi]